MAPSLLSCWLLPRRRWLGDSGGAGRSGASRRRCHRCRGGRFVAGEVVVIRLSGDNQAGTGRRVYKKGVRDVREGLRVLQVLQPVRVTRLVH